MTTTADFNASPDVWPVNASTSALVLANDEFDIVPSSSTQAQVSGNRSTGSPPEDVQFYSASATISGTKLIAVNSTATIEFWRNGAGLQFRVILNGTTEEEGGGSSLGPA